MMNFRQSFPEKDNSTGQAFKTDQSFNTELQTEKQKDTDSYIPLSKEVLNAIDVRMTK